MKIIITEDNRDEISLDREIKNDHVVLDGLTNFTIDGVDFSFDGNDDMLKLNNCIDCKILNCTFHDRTKKGNFIHLRGARSKRNLIENCMFRNHSSPTSNGGEAIIIGLDKWSGCLFETTVRKCEFIDCRGDPEIISIKSVDNVIENNCIRDTCDGNITVRHGGRNTIQNNVFEGPAGGIRILGCGNKIIGNYHKDNDNGSVKRRPLIIQNGLKERDPNFRDNCIPKDQEGSIATYAQASKNIIEDNIYDNCGGPKACVSWGWKQETEHKRKPKNNDFRRNILIADRKDSEFLKFINKGEDNIFEDNKMFGDGAKRGDLPEESVERLEDPPTVTIPDTRCAVP